MLLSITLESIAEQGIRIGLVKVRCPIFFGPRRGSASNHQAVAALVKHLRYAGQNRRTTWRPVEADSYEACRDLPHIAHEAPRATTGLVVQSGVEIPRSRC